MVAFESGDRARRAATPLPEDLLQAILRLKALILWAPSRRVYFEVRYGAPATIYTDASWKGNEKHPCTAGAVFFSERPRKPLGLFAVVSQENLDALSVRKQYIRPCEMMATSLALHICTQALANVGVICLLDNAGS